MTHAYLVHMSLWLSRASPSTAVFVSTLQTPTSSLLANFQVLFIQVFTTVMTPPFWCVLFSRISKRCRKASARWVHIHWSWSFPLSSLPFVSSTPLEMSAAHSYAPVVCFLLRLYLRTQCLLWQVQSSQRDGVLRTLKHIRRKGKRLQSLLGEAQQRFYFLINLATNWIFLYF